MRLRSSTLCALGLVFFTLGFGVFQARSLIVGPKLTITSPLKGATLHDTMLTIAGEVRNATEVRVNGLLVTPDTSGHFTEHTLTPEGYSSVLIEAKNRFGRRTQATVDFLGAPTQETVVSKKTPNTLSSSQEERVLQTQTISS